jgi:hypothetical protein
MVVSASHETVQAQIPAVEPTEERETEVYTAPGDMLIANVVYTPAGDIQGDCDRPRYMQLRVGRFNEPGGRSVADASAQNSDFHLPAGVPQNLVITATTRLYVRAGETLYWCSHIMRSHYNDGIPDPGGIVEVVLEPTNVDEAGPAQLVPRYWQGKTMAINYDLARSRAVVVPSTTRTTSSGSWRLPTAGSPWK